MKKIVTLGLAIGLATILFAKDMTSMQRAQEEIKKIAGAKGAFAQKEKFPKDYFLISKNLPSLVGLVSHYDKKAKLALSDTQKVELKKIKEETKPSMLKAAKEIKTLELALADDLIKGVKAEEASKAVDKIASLKAALTKQHIVCITKARAVLTSDQLKKLVAFVEKKNSAKKEQYKKGNAHPVEELVDLPHPIKVIIPNKEKLKISADQEKALEEKMMAVFPEKIHGNMDKAEVIEKKIKKAVLSESKTKEDLKDEIKALTDIKVAITNDHIDALNILKTILTKSQFTQLLTILD